MGSQSDWPTLHAAADMLDALGVAYESRIVSAHRTPDRMSAYAKQAQDRGLKVIIAGAGGAAHLPGMVASMRPNWPPPMMPITPPGFTPRNGPLLIWVFWQPTLSVWRARP